MIVTVWGWSIVWSTKTAFAYLSDRAYGRCVATTAVMLIAWVGGQVTDWNALYVNGMFWVHRDTVTALADAYESDRPMTMPSWMEHLSANGKIERQGNALYLPVFLDQWRGESGAGIAYLPNGSRRVVQTAAGDIGYPVRDLGGDWWWVE
ncbi:hypothetical protein ACQP2K_00850 [Microbispora siamensis]